MSFKGILDSGYARIAQVLSNDSGESSEDDSGYSGGSAKGLMDYLEEKYGVSVWLSEGPSGLTLSKLVVPEEMQNQGIGSAVMEEICAYADSMGYAIGLTPDSVWGGSVGRLEEFYRGFGFVPNKGRNKDFGFRESWVRPASQ